MTGSRWEKLFIIGTEPLGMSHEETLRELKQFDTPSITNVVATYPDMDLCLELYDPWDDNWYTDQTIECMYPDMGPRVGYAVTCVYGPPEAGSGSLSFFDVTDALEAQHKPTILAMQQDFPPDISGHASIGGELLTAAMKSLGCVGCVSDGPVRDVDVMGGMGVQYLVTGVSPAHGDLCVKAVDVPVSICGMDVSPGEIIHMDSNGAVKFPADRASDILLNVRKLEEHEQNILDRLERASSSDDVRESFTGEEYGDTDDQ